MIDFFTDTSSLDAKTAFVRGGLADSKHTISMQEAESKVAREYLPVKRLKSVKNVDGLTFGHWRVIGTKGILKRSENNGVYVECECDCGVIRDICSSELRNGKTESCGCSAVRGKRTHDMSYSREFAAWSAIKFRCYKKTAKKFSSYGGRGIAMCEQWRNSFEDFYKDMGDRPSKNHSIDRKNNDGGYWCGKCEECLRLNHPSNCRWATSVEQQRNLRSNRLITFNGETRCVTEWAGIIGMKVITLSCRVRNGWTAEDALLKPIQKKHAKSTP